MSIPDIKYLDKNNGILSVCYYANAGAGRFFVMFVFLNKNNQDVKLHPFISLESSWLEKEYKNDNWWIY